MPREDGYKNLIKRTPEELREMAKKGGQANKERLARQKTLNEIAKAILLKPVSENKARSILGEYADLLENKTLGEILTLRQALEAEQGNTKAYEVLRDTAGFKPVEQVQTDVNIMTDADRDLLEKVAKRTGAKAPEEP